MTERTDVPRLDAYHWEDHDWDSWAELRDWFEWEIPERFNLADYVCDRWADDRGRVALFYEHADGDQDVFTYWEIRNAANRLANHLRAQGVERGDRVAIDVPEKGEHLIAHVAAWKLGAVSLPLSNLTGPKGLGYFLQDAAPTACVVDGSHIDTYRQVAPSVASVETTLTVGDVEPRDGEADLWTTIEDRSREFENVSTAPDDPAIVVYTSGTTGRPKGVVMGHQVVLRALPMYVISCEELSVTEDIMAWTPVPWSAATIVASVFPTLFYGNPLVGFVEDGPFDPTSAFRVIDEYDVTTTVLPPTVIRLLLREESVAAAHDFTDLEAILAASEAVPQSLKDAVRERFGVRVEEIFGQTENIATVGSCSPLGVSREGAIGKAPPGYEVRLVDPDDPSTVVDAGDLGEIAVRATDGGFYFEEYLGKPEATERKFHDGWLLTGDLGRQDADGYVAYETRKEDVIVSGGHRIGPGGIEGTLAAHDAVVEAGVIGVPDDVRGEVPKAFVVPAEGHEPSEELAAELQAYVKEQLAKYEYPREVEFVDEIPKSGTGSVQRFRLRQREGVEREHEAGPGN